MRKTGILQMANTSRTEYNVSCSSREQGAGVGGDLRISPPVVPYGPGHHSPLLLPPRTLTMMEPTTGPLITHHRAVLSFISQQLTDRQRERTEIMFRGSGLGWATSLPHCWEPHRKRHRMTMAVVRVTRDVL